MHSFMFHISLFWSNYVLLFCSILYIFLFFLFSINFSYFHGPPYEPQFVNPCAKTQDKLCISSVLQLSPVYVPRWRWQAGSDLLFYIRDRITSFWRYMSSLMHITWTAYSPEPPKIPSLITLTSHWGLSTSCMKRKRKKKCVTVLVRRLLEKRQWTGTWLWVLADDFLLAGQCAPHLHLFPYLFLSRGCCSTWAEASEEALSWGSRSQAMNRLTAE